MSAGGPLAKLGACSQQPRRGTHLAAALSHTCARAPDPQPCSAPACACRIAGVPAALVKGCTALELLSLFTSPTTHPGSGRGVVSDLHRLCEANPRLHLLHLPPDVYTPRNLSLLTLSFPRVRRCCCRCCCCC